MTLTQETADLEARTAAPLAVREEAGEVIALLRLAVERGVPVEALEKLVALQERYQDRQAKMEFAAALADFQSGCPPIPKQSRATIVSEAKGTKFTYSYAELDTIAGTVRPHLHKLGLSYSWDSEVSEDTVTCTCTLRHANGHSITAKFAAPVDSAARMNATQRHAAALSYARRQSLIQVLGLTTTEPDPDGGDGSGNLKITEEQVASLEALLEETGADRRRFLIYLRVADLSDVAQRDFKMAMAALEAKRQSR